MKRATNFEFIKRALDNGVACCEHVTRDGFANVMTYINTPSKTDGYAECWACFTKRIHWKEGTRCHDCGKKYDKMDMHPWNHFWTCVYEEPIFICTHCMGGDVHKQREAEDYEAFANLGNGEEETYDPYKDEAPFSDEPTDDCIHEPYDIDRWSPLEDDSDDEDFPF